MTDTPQQPAAPAVLNAADAQARIGELKSDPAWAARYASGDKKALAEFTRLHELAAGETKAPVAEHPDPEIAAYLRHDPPAQSPAEYVMPYVGELYDRSDVQQFHGAVREALHFGQFPKDVGSAVAQEADRVINRLGQMDGESRARYRQTEQEALKGIWGANAAQNIALARQLAEELSERYPAIEAVLEAGAGDSAMVINLIFGHAQRLAMIRDRREAYTTR